MMWDLTHNPAARPLGCNGRYGRSGARTHYRNKQTPCPPCQTSQNHYQREHRRGAHKPRTPKPCGTNAAAKRHQRHGEPTCFPCRIAEAAYVAQLKTKAANKAASDFKGDLR